VTHYLPVLLAAPLLLNTLFCAYACVYGYLTEFTFRPHPVCYDLLDGLYTFRAASHVPQTWLVLLALYDQDDNVLWTGHLQALHLHPRWVTSAERRRWRVRALLALRAAALAAQGRQL
jgi:hypothetical protein